MIQVLFLAIALAMDAFALSIVNGLKFKGYSLKDVLSSSFSFGLFQSGMPLIGYLLITPFISYIEKYDHWITFIILGYLGYGMIKEGMQKEDIEKEEKQYTFKLLIIQSIATSIDALSVGVTLSTYSINPYIICLIIGVMTCVICLGGHLLGKKLSLLLKDKAVIFGGLTLVIIGLKTLLEAYLG